MVGRSVWICSGDELSFFADQLQKCGLVGCKLQMMRRPDGDKSRTGPMLAARLTLRHYAASSRNCPTLPAFASRVALESPRFDRLGIHVMVSQNARGGLTIATLMNMATRSSHSIDGGGCVDLIMGYLNTFLDMPTLQVAARWHGTYVAASD